MDNASVIIDLSKSEKASFDNNQHLFHRRIYERIANRVVDQLEKSTRAYSDCSSTLNGSGSHDAILLHGDRGVGKTSMLFNLRPYMRASDAFAGKFREVLFLDPVDPTLLNDGEDFLSIVVSQINRNCAVADKIRACRPESVEAYYRALDELASALENEQLAHDRSGLDRLLSYQGGLEISQLSHRYFKEVLTLTGTKLIVLAVDDVDMSLDKGLHVLDVIRKFLCSPYILPLVSGHFELYDELMSNHFSEKLVNKHRSGDDQRKLQRDARELATEYLRKVFPVDRRHAVPTIERYFDGFSDDGNPCRAAVHIDGRELIDLKSLGHLVDAVLNGTVNGEENSRTRFRPATARQLLQFVRTIALPLKSILPDQAISFDSLEKALAWWTGQSQDTVNSIASILGAYFEFDAPRESALCKDLARLNNASDSNTVQLTDLDYLNPAANMGTSNAPERDNENFPLYLNDDSEFAAQRKHLPKELRESKVHSFAPMPAFEPIDRKLKFVQSYRLDNVGEDERFFVTLFSTTDFYTSYQTARLIFFGRFFELITTSLLRDIDEEWLWTLLARPPYLSILAANATKTYDWDEDFDEVDEHGEAPATSLISPDYIRTLVEEINSFRREYLSDTPAFLDLALISAVQSKYFNQNNLFKKQGYGKGKRKVRVERLVGNGRHLLAEIGLRAIYSYWSSMGSFEASKFYFGQAPRVSHTNFSAFYSKTGENLFPNPSYYLNIFPFVHLEKDGKSKMPFSTALDDHPVFKRLWYLAQEIRETADDVMPETNTNEFWTQLENMLRKRNAVSAVKRNRILRSIGASLANGKRLDDELAEWLDLVSKQLIDQFGVEVLSTSHGVGNALGLLGINPKYIRVIADGFKKG